LYTYKLYTTHPFPFFKSDQLNLIVLRSIDVIIIETDILGDGKNGFLRNFENIFLKRTTFIATIIYFLLMGFCIFWIFQAYNKYIRTKETIDILSAVGGVLSLIGLNLPNLLKKESIVRFFESKLRKFLGYKV